MQDITPDICDQYGEQVKLLNLPLSSFGQRVAFWGEVVTVRCYHDNSKVKEAIGQPGQGKVLVVDGNGSCQHALIGDQMAIEAIDNGWEGIVIYGALRDVAQLAQMDIGIQALGTCPFKTHRRGTGAMNVPLTMNNQIVVPGSYLYADWNGILLSDTALDFTL